MFDFDAQFSPESATRIVASESQKLSAAERRRDAFESHRHRVFAVSYYMTANEIEAEEILTQTFLNAFSADEPEPDAADVDRALVRELELRFSLDPAESAVPDPTRLSRTSTRRTDLEEALPALPPAERLVFLLSDVEGYQPPRIATLLDRSEREILRTLISARIRMRNALAAAQAGLSMPDPEAISYITQDSASYGQRLQHRLAGDETTDESEQPEETPTSA